MSRRPRLVVIVLAVVGLSTGILGAYFFTGRSDQFTARATLAMLPTADIPIDDLSTYWEVLNRGQATRSAAVVLEDKRWLDAAAASAGVPGSGLTLSAAAIPETTLVSVTMRADSPKNAEGALNSVLTDAIGSAAAVAGPFRLEVIDSPDGSARSMSSASITTFGGAGMAGLLVGSGAGFLISRSMRGGRTHRPVVERGPGSPTHR